MVFDNLEVNHKAFGKGTVVSYQGKYITVRFDKAQKIFVYPEVFEKYLTLADGTIPEEISVDINNAKLKKQMIIDKKKEENIINCDIYTILALFATSKPRHSAYLCTPSGTPYDSV